MSSINLILVVLLCFVIDKWHILKCYLNLIKMYTFYWLRKFIRNNTRPIPEFKAILWHNRLSIIYNLSAFTALGVVIYASFHDRSDWAKYHGLKSEEETNLSPGNYSSKVLNYCSWEEKSVKFKFFILLYFPCNGWYK